MMTGSHRISIGSRKIRFKTILISNIIRIVTAKEIQIKIVGVTSTMRVLGKDYKKKVNKKHALKKVFREY